MTAAWILAGGVIAGALDILYAMGYWAIKAGTPATRILQSVAAGVLGPASFKGGTATALLGLALHFLIAIGMSVAYWLVARRWALLRERPVACGLLYGLLMYLTMTFVVVPLSRAASGVSSDKLWVTLTILVHMVLIGVPIALAARRAIAARGPITR